MSPKRVSFLMISILVILCVFGVFSIIYGNDVFQKQSKQLIAVKLEQSVVDEQQVVAVAAQRDIAKYTNLEKIAKAIVPQDKDQAKTVRELSQIAEDSGIKLKSISFPTSNLGIVVPKPASTVDDTAANKNKGSNSAAKPETPAVPAAPPLSQVKSAEGIPGVFTLEITLASTDNPPIPYNSFLDFLARLENNRRTAHVDKMTITPSDNNAGVKFTITLNGYVKP